MTRDPTNPFQDRSEIMRTTGDERRGRDANLGGRPFNPAENIDWQRGWEIAQADRRLDEDEA